MFSSSAIFVVFFVLRSAARPGRYPDQWLTLGRDSYSTDGLDLSLSLSVNGHKQDTQTIPIYYQSQASPKAQQQIERLPTSHTEGGPCFPTQNAMFNQIPPNHVVYSNNNLPLNDMNLPSHHQGQDQRGRKSAETSRETESKQPHQKRPRKDQDVSDDGIRRRCFQCNKDQVMSTFRPTNLFLLKSKKVKDVQEAGTRKPSNLLLVDGGALPKQYTPDKEFRLVLRKGKTNIWEYQIPFEFESKVNKGYFNNIQDSIYAIKNRFDGPKCGMEFWGLSDNQRAAYTWNLAVAKGLEEIKTLGYSTTCAECPLPKTEPENLIVYYQATQEYLPVFQQVLLHMMPVILYDVKKLCQAFPGIRLQARMTTQELQRDAWDFYNFLWKNGQSIMTQEPEYDYWKKELSMSHQDLENIIKDIGAKAIASPFRGYLTGAARQLLAVWMSKRSKNLYKEVFQPRYNKFKAAFVSILNEFYGIE